MLKNGAMVGAVGMKRRFSAAGAGVGALLGALTRGGLAIHYLSVDGKGLMLAVAASAGIGLVTGGVAGAMGRAWLGALVGGALSVALYYLMLPVVLLLEAFNAVTTVANPLTVAVAGALAGGLGAALGSLIDRGRDH